MYTLVFIYHLRYPSKKIILLLNKIDLVPRQNVEKWMAYLRNSFPTVAFKSSTQKKGKISQKDSKFSSATYADMQGSESLGNSAMLFSSYSSCLR